MSLEDRTAIGLEYVLQIYSLTSYDIILMDHIE